MPQISMKEYFENSLDEEQSRMYKILKKNPNATINIQYSQAVSASEVSKILLGGLRLIMNR